MTTTKQTCLKHKELMVEKITVLSVECGGEYPYNFLGAIFEREFFCKSCNESIYENKVLTEKNNTNLFVKI